MLGVYIIVITQLVIGNEELNQTINSRTGKDYLVPCQEGPIVDDQVIQPMAEFI